MKQDYDFRFLSDNLHLPIVPGLASRKTKVGRAYSRAASPLSFTGKRPRWKAEYQPSHAGALPAPDRHGLGCLKAARFGSARPCKNTFSLPVAVAKATASLSHST